MKETTLNMALPGADLIERGIEDLRTRRESAEALYRFPAIDPASFRAAVEDLFGNS